MFDWLRRLFTHSRADGRVEAVEKRYLLSLRKAVKVMPGDERLRTLLHEAEQAMKGR